MSEAILILGDSGTGKSTSIRNLPKESTFVINSLGKDLPFAGSRKMYSPSKRNLFIPNLSDEANARRAAREVVDGMRAISDKRKSVKYIIIDDFQYIISSEYMERAEEGGFDKFRDMGKNAYIIFQAAKTLREDIKVIILAHTEEIGKGSETRVVMKTFGKMFRTTVTPEGYFGIVLITDPEYDEIESEGVSSYRFRTQTNGTDPVKSPEGMFPLYIPNDLKLVCDRIDEYYNEGLLLADSQVLKTENDEETEDD